MRLLFVITFLVASGVGLHFSGVDLLGKFQLKKVSSKKISVVKPKFTHQKIGEPEIPVYTFFETLNDHTMSQYVDLNGKVLTTAIQPAKISASASVAPAKTTTPPEKAKKSEPQPTLDQKSETLHVKERPPRYAVQVSSFRDVQRAGALKMRLQEKGFDAFLMQTELADHGGTWHRVFLGRYADEKKAQEAAQIAKSQYKLNAVVVSKTN
jgi:cell division septation protein DedD